jgi:hypothetical protein
VAEFAGEESMKIRTLGPKLLTIAFALAMTALPATAQAEKSQPAFGISREGHFLLFPKGPLADPDGGDMTEVSP